jgi:hypothetical protein
MMREPKLVAVVVVGERVAFIGEPESVAHAAMREAVVQDTERDVARMMDEMVPEGDTER